MGRWPVAAVLVCSSSLLLQLLLAWVPPPDIHLEESQVISGHLLMELVAIIVAALIAAVSWHTMEAQPG